MPKEPAKKKKTEAKGKTIADMTEEEKFALFMSYRAPRETQFRIVSINMQEIFSVVRDMAIEQNVLLINLIGAAETLMANMDQKEVDMSLDMGMLFKDIMKKTYDDLNKQSRVSPGNMFG